MISNLKVTDGDMLIVNVDEGSSQMFIERVRDKLDKWCKAKGLHNVDILITTSNIKITKMTVNDPIDDILKDEQ